ncbi:MAG: gliding motility-associated C-terminal domain-containing protein [Bacteroidia bacterium]
MKKNLLLLYVFFFALQQQSEAFHIVGGDFTCKWIGPNNNFEVTMKMFRDCWATNGAQFDQSINIGVYDKVTNVLQTSFVMNLGTITTLHYAGNLCSDPPNVCVEQGTYIQTVTIPDNPHGYYLIWERCCRNITVINIANPSAEGMGFYLEIANPALHNSSPVFLNAPLPYMCQDQLFNYNFGGWDTDGDSLSFSFDAPLAGGHTSSSNPNPYSASGPGAGNLIPAPAPYYNVGWAPGYSVANIIDGNPTLGIDPLTGKMTAVPLSTGLFAMAVEMKEWRNGVQIGLVRRELEFVVIVCSGNILPTVVSSVPLSSTSAYVLYATDSVCVNITATDPKDSLFITHSGDVFPGGTISGPYATVNDLSGLRNVTTTFCWKPTCAQSSANPYHVRITVTDNGCPLPKTKYFDFNILVKNPPAIDPPNLLCTEFLGNDALRLYWGNLNPPSQFFSYYLIYKSTNGSPYVLTDTIYDQLQIAYVDSNAANNTVTDYCYYIKTVNVCQDAGTTSDTICTLSQINTKTNYMATATVNAANKIGITWQHFADGPFSTLYIYKKENSVAGQFNLWQTLFHKAQDNITDYDVQTDLYSYTYKMTNEDYCSNLSPESNIATTVLLNGLSAPFVNTINWSRYETWNGGVNRYVVYRKKDPLSEFELLAVITDTVYVDKDLDVTGGEFFYKIRAVEGAGSMNADSWSNEIELLQSPQVFIPNAFTPNDDAVNETWKPIIVFVRDYSLLVFNRWGQKVFESTDETASWNGKLQGKDCVQGTYFYVLKFTGYDTPDEYRKTGVVTLVR